MIQKIFFVFFVVDTSSDVNSITRSRLEWEVDTNILELFCKRLTDLEP